MKKVGGFIINYYRLFLLLILIIVTASVAANSWQNFINVVMLQAPYMLIYSMGMTLVILTGGLDLSLGANAALSTCLGAFLIKAGYIIPGILVTLGVGLTIGLLNGIIITKFKVAPFIATYGMDWVARGAVYVVMMGVAIFGFDKSFTNIAQGSLLGISNLLFIAGGIFLILFFVFQKTTFGRNVYMMGSNMEVAKLTGVKTDNILIIVYMISGLMAAIAGLLYVARLDTAESFIGKGFSMMALAATLVGGTSLSGGKGGVANTLVGVLILVFLTNALNLMRVDVLWEGFVYGIVIVLAAILERARTNYILRTQI